MKTRLDRYILSNVLRVGVIALLLCSFVMVTVDLISNLADYIRMEVPFATIALRSLYYAPEAVLMCTGPAFLFSLTYFLSQLSANNEMICLLNAGIPYRRILRPCLVLAFCVAGLYFAFSEQVGIPAGTLKNRLEEQIFYSSTTYDNRNVSLYDSVNGYVLYARRYIDSESRLKGTVLIHRNSDGTLDFRMESDSALWVDGNWEFNDNTVFEIDPSGSVKVTKPTHLRFEDLDINVQMFRSTSADVTSMPIRGAWDYLQTVREFEPSRYPELATDFWQRVLSFLTPLVLMIIACSINYRFKKNILLFSIVSCLCIGVVYYVVQMLTLILASQGMISPISGTLAPVVMILVFSVGLTATFRT